MNLPKRFIKIDFAVQTILAVVILATLYSMTGLFLLLPFGLWQLISASCLVLIYKDKKRRYYLVIALLYLIFLWFAASYTADSDARLYLLFFVLPAGLGLWYYLLTLKDLRAK